MLSLRKIKLYTLVSSLLASNVKRMSATQPYIKVSVDQDNIAVLTIQKPKVNSLCPELLRQMADSLDNIKKNKIMGVVLTSVSNKILFFFQVFLTGYAAVTTFRE